VTCRNCEQPRYRTYALCRDHWNERRRANYRYNPRQKDAWLKHKYGLSVAMRDQMLAEQDGCAVCHTWESGGQGWCIDHDHACCPGKRSCGRCVRGVVCFSCNVGLGAFKDDIEVMARAIDYLQANVSRRLPA
jgi:hypothetical protein